MIRTLLKLFGFLFLSAFIFSLFFTVLNLCTGNRVSKSLDEYNRSNTLDSIAKYKGILDKEINYLKKGAMENISSCSDIECVKMMVTNIGSVSRKIIRAETLNNQLKDTGLTRAINQIKPIALNQRIVQFPILRAKSINLLSQVMWQQNIEVHAYGNSGIRFVGGLFTSNKNKKAFIESDGMDGLIKMLRFKQVNIACIASDGGITWTYQTPLDTDL